MLFNHAKKPTQSNIMYTKHFGITSPPANALRAAHCQAPNRVTALSVTGPFSPETSGTQSSVERSFPATPQSLAGTMAGVALALLLSHLSALALQSPLSLGTAGNYAILAKSG